MFTMHAIKQQKKSEGEKNRNQNIVIVVKSIPLAAYLEAGVETKMFFIEGVKGDPFINMIDII